MLNLRLNGELRYVLELILEGDKVAWGNGSGVLGFIEQNKEKMPVTLDGSLNVPIQVSQIRVPIHHAEGDLISMVRLDGPEVVKILENQQQHIRARWGIKRNQGSLTFWLAWPSFSFGSLTEREATIDFISP